MNTIYNSVVFKDKKIDIKTVDTINNNLTTIYKVVISIPQQAKQLLRVFTNTHNYKVIVNTVFSFEF